MIRLKDGWTVNDCSFLDRTYSMWCEKYEITKRGWTIIASERGTFWEIRNTATGQVHKGLTEVAAERLLKTYGAPPIKLIEDTLLLQEERNRNGGKSPLED